MKKVITVLATVILVATVWAQAPETFSYQSVIRNSSNQLVQNKQVGVRISIQKKIYSIPPSYQNMYVETHIPITNENGLISLRIGGGTVVSGSFSNIDWSNGEYFIKTEVDPNGGTNYTITGLTQLLSVPYALHAKTAENLKNIDALLSRIEALEESDLLNHGFTDDRDGNSYKAVKIGNQIWMAENLRYLPSVAGPGTESLITPCYYVYNYDGTDVNAARATSNYKTYGVLYNWPAAMAGSASSSANPSGVKGVCPTGWHLPSDAEWTELTNYLGGLNVAGGKLKETGTTHWAAPNTGATNETGFTALPGGTRSDNGTFLNLNYFGRFWSATQSESNNTVAWMRQLYYDDDNVAIFGYSKELGFSVRCVKD